MRVLLTGASGFVGGHAARTLAAAGHELHVLARPSSDLRGLAALSYTRVLGDLAAATPDALAAAVDGVDAVVHVAGLTAAVDPRAFDRVNRRGTAALVEAARAAGVSRFVYVSSLAALGPSPGGLPESPQTPVHPITPYGRSKAEGEQAVLAAAGAMTVQVLRPPAVYGPGDRGLLPFFRLARWHAFLQYGRGDHRLSFIYGPDLAEAIAALVDAPAEAVPIYHIADAEGPYTWRFLAGALAAALGSRVIRVPLPGVVFRGVARGGEALAWVTHGQPVVDRSRVTEMAQPAWVCESAALQAATGWAPRTPLAEGLEATVAWYREQRWI